MCDQIYEVCECDYVECEWLVRMSGMVRAGLAVTRDGLL